MQAQTLSSTFSSSTYAPSSTLARRTGWTLTTVAVLFLIFDAAVKVFFTNVAVEATGALGMPLSMIVPVGVIELACLIVYVVPRTSLIGAVLWTGYLGGAIAIQLRAGNPLFSHVLFPIYIAALIWGGLFLRDRRLRALL